MSTGRAVRARIGHQTLTATLLATLVGDGTVALDDGIGRWLAAGPNANITLDELATHTSIDCSRRPLSLLVVFAPSGHIAGLRILGPDEAAPW